MKTPSFAKIACIAIAFCAATATSSPAQTLTFSTSFDETSNGDYPNAPLIGGPDGNYYGTTSSEFGTDFGTVYQVTSAGVVTTIYKFCSLAGCADGSYPVDSLVLAKNGNFYGTTNSGGANNFGTVFELTPSGELTTLYSFCSLANCADGRYPVGGLVQAANGNFYGTTPYGGGPNGYGTVFQITAAGKLTTLYSFCSDPSCPDGGIPFGNLIQGPNGALYGTSYGGDANRGNIFKITTAGKLTVLHSFCSLANCADGDEPYDGLTLASNGKFYGTTSQGGAYPTLCSGNGCGTVFQMTATGALTTLYNFCSKAGCPDGYTPTSGLIQASDGNLYGTVPFGGKNGYGLIYKITTAGKLTGLFNFDGTNGTNPQASLVQASNGGFYGTTESGGSDGYGTVFNLSLGTER